MSKHAIVEYRLEVYSPHSTAGSPDRCRFVTFQEFVAEFSHADWERQAAHVPWAQNGWPGLAIVRLVDEFRLWICAYDWAVDFGICKSSLETDNTTGFIVGVLNVPTAQDRFHDEANQTVSGCDFLFMDPNEIKYMAKLFFQNDDRGVIDIFRRSAPINRFS